MMNSPIRFFGAPARKPWMWASAAGLAAVLAAGLLASGRSEAEDSKKAAGAASTPAKPALSVAVVQLQRQDIAQRIAANGSIHAWQEASIGSEVNGLRLAEVRASVGDRVQRGQVLAVFAPETVRAELAQVKASLAEAEAMLAEAAANAQRARDLQASGALSAQQINQLLTAERTAQARLEAVKAQSQMQQLRLAQTEVRAPDAGIVSARNATVGAVMGPGQEMFRLIRQGRLEWRAEVTAAELARIAPGMVARLQSPGGAEISGRVRMVAPTVDAQSRNGLVYVDLPAGGNASMAKAGMFARGEFEGGSSPAQTLPQSAVQLRDGFSYVFVVGADSRVAQVKVQTGRRSGDRLEISSGLKPDARVVASGGGFLADGDLVRVVGAGSSPAAPAAAASAQAKS
jgi:HlyD family secretion protein